MMAVDQQTVGRPWHALEWHEVLETLEGNEHGLSEDEAKARLARFGPNELPHKPPPAWWQILLRQFQNPLIYVLAIAALVSLSLGDVKDATFIAIVLGINALIGGYQEWRAEQSAQALQRLLKIRASVERDGEVREIDAEALVPGDIVWLESGNRVPGDIRLMTAHGLEVDESLLTGESLAIMKDPSWLGDEKAPLADRHNMAHAGSIVARGRGRGIVVATGTDTAVGQLAMDVLGRVGGKPPLIERMERFSRVVAIVVLIAAVLVALIGIFGRGYTLLEMFFFAVALAVSAIPEGLPAALTVALSIATTRMARRGVIVRRLAAVEGLGSCTLIASDKTGTLTVNELTVREVRLPDGQPYEVTGQGFVPEGQIARGGQRVDPADSRLQELALAAVLCNEGDLHQRNGAWVWHGDPTDVALLSFAHKLGRRREPTLAQYAQVNEIPFEPEYRFSATYHAIDGGVGVFVKGAPERVLEMCRFENAAVQREQLHAVAREMAQQGYRVLALAAGDAPPDLQLGHAPPEPSGLRLLGFVGMIDPLRPGVRQAVEACHAAGIDVWMVTGDHPITALAIARDLGMATEPEQVITGIQLAEMSEEELRKRIQTARVFARVAPQQKLQLVLAAREAGHFVAVTGDGVNDAPALRTANIGIAMGRAGTDVAREAAELVISDDNFATIVSGVEEGRVAYENVRNVIFLLISTGAAEVVLAGLTLIAGLPLPLLPVQLLWLNLVTNGIQGVALAFEPGKGDELRHRPRPPKEPIFNQLMIERTVIAALVMGCLGFIVFRHLINTGWDEVSARNVLLLFMVLFENVHIGNCRSETHSAFALSPLRSPMLLAGALGALLVHVAMMYIPFGQAMLQAEPVSWRIWLTLIALAMSVLIAVEIHKWTWRWRYGHSKQAVDRTSQRKR